MELGHFDKHWRKTSETKTTQGKNIRFFHLETLKKLHIKWEILLIDDHNLGNFSPNWGTFFQSSKKGKEALPPPPPLIPPYSYAPALSDSIKKSFISGELSTSQKQAAINLIEMKDKNKRLIKNWRQFLCSI